MSPTWHLGKWKAKVSSFSILSHTHSENPELCSPLAVLGPSNQVGGSRRGPFRHNFSEPMPERRPWRKTWAKEVFTQVAVPGAKKRWQGMSEARPNDSRIQDCMDGKVYRPTTMSPKRYITTFCSKRKSSMRKAVDCQLQAHHSTRMFVDGPRNTVSGCDDFGVDWLLGSRAWSCVSY